MKSQVSKQTPQQPEPTNLKDIQEEACSEVKSWTFYKVYKKISRSLPPMTLLLLSIYLDKSDYFMERFPEHDGWFFCPQNRVAEEIDVDVDTVRRHKNRLSDLGIIELRRGGCPCREWIRIDYIRVVELCGREKNGKDGEGMEVFYPPKEKKGSQNTTSRGRKILPIGIAESDALGLQNLTPWDCRKGGSNKETRNKKTKENKETRDKNTFDHFLQHSTQKELEGEDAKPTAPIQPESQHPRPRQKIEPWIFPHFWTAYPRKQAKKKAKAIWDKLCHQSDRPTWGEIRRAIAQQKKTVQWQDKQYIPQPTTWLNQGRWEDDIDALGGYASDSFQDPAKAEEYELDRARKDLLQWFEREQGKHRPTWDKMPDPMSPEGATYMLWNDMIPRPDSLLRRFEEWLRDQDWIGDPAPGHYKPGGATVVRFLQYINDKIGGFDVFTGRSLE